MHTWNERTEGRALTPPKKELTLQGVIEDVTFRSGDGRFAVVRMRDEDSQKEPFVAVGDLGLIAAGETLRITGRWMEHSLYGRQFQICSFTPLIPTTKNGLVRYLGSGLIAGIGPALAKRLVDRFGEETLNVISTQSAKLLEISGIGQRRAIAIGEAVRSRREESETLAFLYGSGFGTGLARRVLRRYGNDAVRIIRDDPYLMAEEVAGIGFRTADQVGQNLGILKNDPRRAAGAVLHVLAKGADEGHVFLTRDELVEETKKLDVLDTQAATAIEHLALAQRVVLDEARVYAPPLFRAERAVATRFRQLSQPRTAKIADTESLLRPWIQQGLSEEQMGAVRASLRNGLVILTGGPGTGKTTSVKSIVGVHRELNHRVLLCAPTGRAAKRLSETTGIEAKTIHRALEWNPGAKNFRRNAQTPLDADVILVDESSMLNLPLAERLLQAVPEDAVLILVGDVDQLPPIGAGHVLRDVLESRVGEVVRLTRVFRQAQKSAIVRGAHAMLEGKAPIPTPTGTHEDGDLFYIQAEDPENASTLLLQSLRRIQTAYGLHPARDVQVLTPMRRGPLGTERLNQLLQREINQAHASSIASGEVQRMAAGDKVMQLRNDYDRDVFNGDMGTITRIADGITEVDFEGRNISYTIDDLDALTLAYACTIHKAQGSEFPGVIVMLHSTHHVLLSRALLYTAITRAKRFALIIGDQRLVRRSLARNKRSLTHSRLAELLRGY